MSEPPAAPPAGAPALDGRAYLRLIGIGVVIGIPAAVVAIAFLGLVHEAEHLLWDVWPESLGLDAPPWWLIVGLPLAGALLVWLARAALPGGGGHEPLDGISAKPTPIAYAPGIALAAFGSLAFGAVLGPEAPLIALGSVVGMIAVRWWKVDGPGLQVLSTAGAFSAISALFGGPVVAGAILLEAGIGAGAALIPLLLPGMVAAAVGYTLVVGLGSWAGIPTSSLSVPDLPAYPNTTVADLLCAIVVGALVSLLVVAVRVLAHRVQDLQMRLGMGYTLIGGALAISGLALAVDALGGSSVDVLFSGQSSLPNLLGTDTEYLVIAVLLGKALAYAVCLGAGFRGGPVFPAIFIGTAAAMTVGWVVDLSPTAALAIGCACGMAAFTRLIFSSLVFAMLLTGVAGAAAMPAAVLAAAAAWVMSSFLDKRVGHLTRPAPDPA
jgi:H+/Cl- antiporter ClcA